MKLSSSILTGRITDECQLLYSLTCRVDCIDCFPELVEMPNDVWISELTNVAAILSVYEFTVKLKCPFPSAIPDTLESMGSAKPATSALCRFQASPSVPGSIDPNIAR